MAESVRRRTRLIVDVQRPVLARWLSLAAPAVRPALALGAVAAVATWLGFYLIAPLPYIDTETFRATVVLHAVTGLVFVPYLVSLVLGRRLPGGSVLDVPVIAFTGVLLLTTATSLNWRVSLEVSLTVLMAIGVFYVLSDGRLFRAWQVEAALVLAAVAAALSAIWVVGADYLDWLRLTSAVRGGLSFGDLLPATVPRVHDVGDHPNLLGAIFAMSLPFLFVAIFRQIGATLRTLAAVAAAAVLLATFLTLSRSAWLGAGLGLLTTGALLLTYSSAGRDLARRAWASMRAPWWLLASLAFAALAVTGLVAVYLAQTVEARPLWLFRASGTPRWDVMEAGAEMVRDNPLLGTGPGVFSLLYPEYSGRFPAHAFHSHNGFLQTTIDMGVPGVLAMLALAGALAWLLIRALRETDGPAQFSIMACSGAFVALASFSLFDAPNGFKGPLVMLAAVGAVAVLSSRERRPKGLPASGAFAWRNAGRAAVLAARFAAPVVMMGVLIVWVARLDIAHYHYSVGLSRANAERWPQALDEAQQAVDLDPTYAVYRLQLGAIQSQAYLDTGNLTLLEDAIGQLERSVELEPRNALGHANLALLLAAANERDAARTHALAVREVANSDPTVVLAAGIALEASNWGEEATRAYAQALQLDAGLADSPFWGATAFRRTRYSDIVARSTLIFNPCLLLSLATVGLPAGPFTRGEALTACQERVAEHPDDAASRVALAEALTLDGDQSLAFAHLDYVLTRQPDFGPARTALGRWYETEGDTAEARVQWLRAGQLNQLDALVELGESYPLGVIPSEVVEATRSELRRSQGQRDLIGVLYYRFKFFRASPVAILPPDELLPDEWQQAVPGRIARAQEALERWTGESED